MHLHEALPTLIKSHPDSSAKYVLTSQLATLISFIAKGQMSHPLLLTSEEELSLLRRKKF